MALKLYLYFILFVFLGNISNLSCTSSESSFVKPAITHSVVGVKEQKQPNVPSVKEKGRELSELEARRMLNSMFRAQGYRILNDVYYDHDGLEFTLDGFDPENEIGFEYVSQLEEGLDLNEQESSQLKSSSQLLIIGVSTESSLELKASVFLERLESIRK